MVIKADDKEATENCCLMVLEPTLQDEKNAGDWQHNNVNLFPAAELYEK